MKRRTTLIAAAAALSALLAVGGTLAWFTDSGEVTNTITVDSMDFKLSEDAYTQDKQTVTPGQIIQKNPTVTKIANMDGYIKMTITPSFGADSSLDLSKVLYSSDGTNFVTLGNLATSLNGTDGIEAEMDGNNLVVYTQLTNTNSSFTPFTHVKFSDEMNNAYRAAQLEIKVEFDAIQAANNITGTTIKDKFTATSYETVNGNEDVNWSTSSN